MEGNKKEKTFASLRPIGSADLHFLRPQPDTSLHCKVTTDRGLAGALRGVPLYVAAFAIVPTHRGMARLSLKSNAAVGVYRLQC